MLFFFYSLGIQQFALMSGHSAFSVEGTYLLHCTIHHNKQIQIIKWNKIFANFKFVSSFSLKHSYWFLNWVNKDDRDAFLQILSPFYKKQKHFLLLFGLEIYSLLFAWFSKNSSAWANPGESYRVLSKGILSSSRLPQISASGYVASSSTVDQDT